MLPRSIEILGASIALTIVLLGWLARRYPHVAWLQPFDFTKNISPEVRARRERVANRMAAIQMILAALLIPFAYVLLKVLLFEKFTATGILVTAALSFICLGFGVYVIATSRPPTRLE